MKKSKKIEMLKAENERLLKNLREIQNIKEDFYTALYKIHEIVNEHVHAEWSGTTTISAPEPDCELVADGKGGFDWAKPGADTTKRVAIWAVPEWVRSMQNGANTNE